MSPLPSSSISCTVATQLPLYVALPLFGMSAPVRPEPDVLDEADAEIVDLLRTVLLGVAKRGPDTEVNVLVGRCFRDLGRHLHVYCQWGYRHRGRP